MHFNFLLLNALWMFPSLSSLHFYQSFVISNNINNIATD